MQIDVDPQEDPQNAPDVNYVVENPTLVGALRGCPLDLPPQLLGSCTGPACLSDGGRGRAGTGPLPLTAAPAPAQDLEQYAASYSGLMRIERLQFIADHCPPLRVEALKMALSFVQRTFNVDVYEEIHRKLSEATR